METNDSVSEIRKQKVEFIAQKLRENNKWRSSDLVNMVKKQFGSSIDGTVVKNEILKARPDYQPRIRLKRLSSEENEVTSMSKIKISDLYKAGALMGESAAKIRALALLATRKTPFVPDFEQEQLDKAKVVLSKTGKVCFTLTNRGTIRLVDSGRVTIREKGE
ncbi:MAG: hypothetical protein WC479_09750 [Candidatus Izemoplasmatales bacterium]